MSERIHEDVPTMFEIQIDPARLVNANGAPCWVHVTDNEAHEIYSRLHARYSGANKNRVVVLLDGE